MGKIRNNTVTEKFQEHLDKLHKGQRMDPEKENEILKRAIIPGCQQKQICEELKISPMTFNRVIKRHPEVVVGYRTESADIKKLKVAGQTETYAAKKEIELLTEQQIQGVVDNSGNVDFKISDRAIKIILKKAK